MLHPSPIVQRKRIAAQVRSVPLRWRNLSHPNRCVPKTSSTTFFSWLVVPLFLLFSGQVHASEAEPDGRTAQTATVTDQTRQVSFAIAPQPLEDALNIFSTKTGILILYNAQITAGRSSQGLSGTLPPRAALQKLLSGTGIVPVEVFPNGYTLVPTPASQELALLATPKAPILTLDTLHVEAPNDAEFRRYALTVQTAIRGALQRDESLRRARYRTDLFVWVSPFGVVEEASYLHTTGNANLDGAIERVVRGVMTGGLPPKNLPQPIHVRILTSASGH